MPFMPLGFAPGEWDWMNRRRGGGILGPAEGGGLFGGITEKLTSPQAQLGLQLLANSGPSRERRGFGQILGQSALGVQQAQAQQQDNDLRRQYMQAQIEQMRRPQDTGPLVPVMRDGKLVYGTRDEARGTEVPARANDDRGAYQPGDYTPESWAEFLKTNDPAVLKRWVTPRQEYSPSYQNVTRTLKDGSTQMGVFNTRTGAYDWTGEVVPGGKRAEVDAAGRARGEAEGGQTAKIPALASLEYVAGEFTKSLENTEQGGLLGARGRAATVTDYEDATRFDNLREQLSTELRTVFRIPGEGTLSDREQAQYGLQLPDRKNSKRVNEAILADIQERARLRIETPVTGGPVARNKPTTNRRVRVDAQGNVIGD